MTTIGRMADQPGCGASWHSLKAVLPLTSGRSTPVAQASACVRVETGKVVTMSTHLHDRRIEGVQGGSTSVWCQWAQPEGCASTHE